MSHPFESSAPAGEAPGRDAFFVLREARQFLEQRLAPVVAHGGVGTPALVSAFTAAVGEAHDELAHDKRDDGFGATEGLTASRITLMCDADLELDIRIGNISRHLAEACGANLWRVQQRYMTLLQRPQMTPEGTPAGTEAITAGLWALCHNSGLDLEHNLQLLQRQEDTLALELPTVYAELGDLLARHGIEPAQPQIVSLGGPRPGAAAARADGGALANLQQLLSARLGAEPGTPLAFGGAGGNGGGLGAGAGGAALNAATLVMLNQLTTRLEQLQQTTAPGAAGTAAEGRPRAFHAADLDLPLGGTESVALETLGHIFESIFELWDLPDTVKTAIGRLQIPLLKLAICDPSLFSDAQHPARRLINAMGRAAIGLPRNVARAHPVSAQLWKIASHVLETVQGDAAALAEPIAQTEALSAERDAAIVAAAQPLIDHLAGNEAQLRGAENVRRWLEAFAARPTAREVHEFVRQTWARVMSVAFADGGESGSAWLEASATIDDLLWSVAPKADAEDRKRLAALVPSLLRRLNAGLDRIGVAAEARRPFLDACFMLQTASLRGAPAAAVTVEPPPAAAAVALPREETVAGLHLRRLGSDAGTLPAYRVAATQAGEWLQITDTERETRTGLVVWVGPLRGTLLLCNPDWDFALALESGVADELRRDGRLQSVSGRAIFDLAADQALREIAKGAAPA